MNIPSGGHAVPADSQQVSVRVPMSYAGAENTPVFFANQFVIQRDRDGFIVGIGQLAPPIILGEKEEREAQIRQIRSVNVTLLGRFWVSRDRAVELRDLLAEQIAVWDAPPGERAEE